MTVSGWKSKYSEILQEFGYNKKNDLESARLLDLIIKNPASSNLLKSMIKGNVVFVIGAGYTLRDSVPILKKYNKILKIVADSAVKPLMENGIMPDIVVTDLDGDEKTLKILGKTRTIFVVHAHGDNISKLQFAKNFKNCLGTTQTIPVGRIHNFGGFTDGDRSVFLADYFSAKKIILVGMDLGKRISRISATSHKDRETKIKKMKKAKQLLEWLALKSKSDLYTLSESIKGFKKISKSKLDIIVT